MKKYLARISVVLWGFAAVVFLILICNILMNFDSSAFQEFGLIIPVVLTVSALSFILTGTVNIKKILKMCQDENSN